MDSTASTTGGGMETCAVVPFQLSTNPSVQALSKLQASIIILAFLMTLALSVFVWYLIMKCSFHFSMRAVAIHAVIIGLTKSITIAPFLFISAVLGKWVLGDESCSLFGVLYDGYTSARILLGALICVDRFLLLFSPGIYERFARRVSVYSSVGIWLLYIPYVALVLKFLRSCYTYQPALKICVVSNNGCLKCELYGYIFFGFFIVIGVVLPAFVVFIMFCKHKRFENRHPQSRQRPRAETDERRRHRRTIEREVERKRQQLERRLLRRLQLEEERHLQQLMEENQPVNGELMEPGNGEPMELGMEPGNRGPTEPGNGGPMEPGNGEQTELPNVNQHKEAEDAARSTSLVLKMVLVCGILFNALPFIVAFVEQEVMEEPSTALYILHVLVIAPMTYVAPLFDLVLVLVYARKLQRSETGTPLSPLSRLIRQRRYQRSYSPRLPNRSPPAPRRLPPPPPTPRDDDRHGASDRSQDAEDGGDAHADNCGYGFPFIPTLSTILESESGMRETAV